MKIWVGCGIFCVLSVLVSSWYAVAFNDSRLVVPMDSKEYVFDIKDLPMIVSVSLTCIYLFALFALILIHAEKNQRQVEETGITRAKLKAYQITFGVMFAALLILCRGKLFGSLEYTLIAVIITLSLALALGIFLSEYLLYRYDHDDQIGEGGE